MLSLDRAREGIEQGTGAGVRIAIIDSGIETSHPQLGGMRLEDDIAVTSDGLRLEVVPGEGKDLYGHGTAIASVIRRIAPEATLGSFRVLNERLGGRHG